MFHNINHFPIPDLLFFFSLRDTKFFKRHRRYWTDSNESVKRTARIYSFGLSKWKCALTRQSKNCNLRVLCLGLLDTLTCSRVTVCLRWPDRRTPAVRKARVAHTQVNDTHSSIPGQPFSITDTLLDVLFEIYRSQ